MSTTDLSEVLQSLEPNERHRVMDLVAQAGINIEPWAIKQGGVAVAVPSANPKYCYEWAFGTGSEPVALCVWHSSLVIEGDNIIYRGNLRQLGIGLESRANDRFETDQFKSRAKKQAARARDFDIHCQDAWRLKLPIRFILLKGDMADSENLGQDSSKVEYRRLDPEPWSLVSYDIKTGDSYFVRGQATPEAVSELSIDEASTSETTDNHIFVDQFSAESHPEKRLVESEAFVRSAIVRAQVLNRAGGVCEACSQAGFRMANGSVYLETHHVIPLSENGPDKVWNIVAICANDHRIAHYCEIRDEWKARMVEHLISYYPDSASVLKQFLK
jgi:5-methylcytosine-specific restriction protein A